MEGLALSIIRTLSFTAEQRTQKSTCQRAEKQTSKEGEIA
jgi:hypothetical protein